MIDRGRVEYCTPYFCALSDCHPNNGCIECILEIVRKIVSKIVRKIVRFRVDNSENWRIVLATEQTRQQRSDNVEFLQVSDAFSCDADDERDSSH